LMCKNSCDDIATVSSLYLLVFNFTTMHAMSHRSDLFLTCSSIVNNSELAFYLTITYPFTVTQIEIPRVQFPTMMSDKTSLNTSLPDILMSLFVIEAT
jgi:hypothetical protein